MTDSESNGRPDMEKIEHMDTNQTGGAPLSRQVTVSMSPEQYERLFFQPSQPKGDLAKRLGMCFPVRECSAAVCLVACSRFARFTAELVDCFVVSHTNQH